MTIIYKFHYHFVNFKTQCKFGFKLPQSITNLRVINNSIYLKLHFYFKMVNKKLNNSFCLFQIKNATEKRKKALG